MTTYEHRFTHGDIESLTPKVGAFIAVAERELSRAGARLIGNERLIRHSLGDDLSDQIARDFPSPHRFTEPQHR